MEIEEQKLSKKTRGILWNIKKIFAQNNANLDFAVQQTFGYRKEKFRPKELCQFIKNIDPRLTYEEIDAMAIELDSDGNGFIFLNELAARLKAVQESDDPFSNKLDQQSVEIMTKSRLARLSEQEQTVLALKQLKDSMRDSDPYQLLDIFDEDRDGFLNQEEFQGMLFNISLTQPKTVQLLTKRLFGSNVKVKFDEIMKAMGLQDIAQRISFEEIPNRKSHIHEIKPLEPPKIEPPKQISPQKKPEQKKVSPPPQVQPKPAVVNPQRNGIVAPKNKSDLPQLPALQSEFSLTEIPPILQPFYNPSSELSEPLASMTMALLLENKTYFDPKNPPTKKPCRYEHILRIFGRRYFLFEEGGQSAIRRDRKGLGLLMEARNINQGSVGDCYFMSAIAGVVEHYPQLIYRLFVLDSNPASIYGIRLFVDGVWHTVITDACFPINQFGQFLFAKPHNLEIWAMLLEKAWAKIYGSYENIHAGFNDEGLTALTGAPCESILSDMDGTVEKLKIYLRKGYIISCSASDMIDQMSQRDQEKMGIFSGHAYSLLRIEVNLQARDRKVTLVKVRNPWGNKEWKGDWSFSSPLWTQQLRDKLNYNRNPNDGSFFMSLEDYLTYFYRITTCFVSLAKVHGHIVLESDRTHSVMVGFTVRTQGDYFLSMYQENRRKYQQSSNYKLSKSRLFLARVVGGRVEAIASKACIAEHLHLETTLEPGQYLVSCKIRWNYHERNSFVLASYGAEVLHFNKVEKDKQFLHSFVESKAEFELGEKNSYARIGLPNCYKIVNMDPKQGFGYILIRNNSNRLLETEIRFNKIHGIKPIKPLTLPLKMIVVPNSSVVRGFLVDPMGFGYEIAEQARVA